LEVVPGRGALVTEPVSKSQPDDATAAGSEGEGEQYPPGPQSESTAQLPPCRQTFAPQSADELRQMHGVFDGQSESEKQSSYEHPGSKTTPSNGKQRPLAPSTHSKSDEQRRES